MTDEEILSILKEGPSKDLDTLINLSREVRDAQRFTLPFIEDGPKVLLERLASVRTAMDTIDGYLVAAIRFRTKMREASSIAVGEHDDAWSRVAGSAAKRGRGADGWGEPAPRERYASADLAVLDEKIKMRKFTRWLATSEDAVVVITQMYRGLDSLRQDLHLILRAMSVESSLER